MRADWKQRMDVLTILLLIVFLFFRTPAAWAQAEASSPRTKQLAEEFSDPLTTLPQVFVQDAYSPANYGTEAQTNRVIIRAIVPRIPRYSLLPFVQLIRPSFFIQTVPTGRGSATRTEFGDMQLFDLAVIPWPGRETGLMMGVGPTFVFPTATDKSAGQGAWQAGPALSLFTMPKRHAESRRRTGHKETRITAKAASPWCVVRR